MLTTLSGSRVTGMEQSGVTPLGIKDQTTKAPLFLSMVRHESKPGQLIQPSRIIPKVFESWPIWTMPEIEPASGNSQSRSISCEDFSVLRIAPMFYSATVGTAKILVTGTTLAGTSFPLDVLFLDVVSGSMTIGTGIMVDEGPGGLVEVNGYVMKPLSINIAGLCRVKLTVLVLTGKLTIDLGVS